MSVNTKPGAVYSVDAKGNVYEHRTTGRPVETQPGLKQMREATPEGLCPFCLDPLPPKKTKPPKHCLDSICATAYQRTYMRDRRRAKRASK